MVDQAKAPPAEQQGAVAQSIERVRELLASGELAPGQRLPAERALADLLGVSRPTVREAIRVLNFIGVLETRLGSGTYVSAMSSGTLGDMLSLVVHSSHEALGDLVEVRVHLEVAAAEIAARRIGNGELVALAALLEECGKALRSPSSFARFDLEFHRQVARAAHNQILARLLFSVSALGLQRRVTTAKDVSLRQVTLDEHAEILAALWNHDPVAARERMRLHMQHAMPHLTVSS